MEKASAHSWCQQVFLSDCRWLQVSALFMHNIGEAVIINLEK